MLAGILFGAGIVLMVAIGWRLMVSPTSLPIAADPKWEITTRSTRAPHVYPRGACGRCGLTDLPLRADGHPSRRWHSEADCQKEQERRPILVAARHGIEGNTVANQTEVA